MPDYHVNIVKTILRQYTRRSIPLLVYRLFRWILGGVFLYACFDKIIHPADFAVAVHNYQILPDELINITALSLPWLEFILGILLICGLWMPGTIVLSNLLLLIFSGALLFNLYRGLDISCGCFSTSQTEKAADIWTIARDASFMLIALYLLLYHYISHARERSAVWKKIK